jgi:hypothetical protein
MSVLLIIATAWTALLDSAQAQNTTTSNTTTNDRVAWAPPPKGRGTINIVWSCVSVLLVCTYKCVHLNISSFEENRAGWHKCYGIPYWPEWPLLRKQLRKLKWMAIILIAPELGVAIASRQYFKACNDLQNAGGVVRDVMGLTHAFYANMGGFAIAIRQSSEANRTSVLSEAPLNLRRSHDVSQQPIKGHQVAFNDNGTTGKGLDLENPAPSPESPINEEPPDLRSICLHEYGQSSYFPNFKDRQSHVSLETT